MSKALTDRNSFIAFFARQHPDLTLCTLRKALCEHGIVLTFQRLSQILHAGGLPKRKRGPRPAPGSPKPIKSL